MGVFVVRTRPTLCSCQQDSEGKKISPTIGGMYFGGIEVDERQYLMLVDRRNHLLETAIDNGAMVIDVTK
jgi:hypothetical protein